MDFPVIGGKMWTLPEKNLLQWRKHYTTKDVDGEIADALQWLYDNPKRIKTSSGMARYLSGWIKRSPDIRCDGGNFETKAADNADLERIFKCKK